MWRGAPGEQAVEVDPVDRGERILRAHVDRDRGDRAGFVAAGEVDRGAVAAELEDLQRHDVAVEGEVAVDDELARHPGGEVKCVDQVGERDRDEVGGEAERDALPRVGVAVADGLVARDHAGASGLSEHRIVHCTGLPRTSSVQRAPAVLQWASLMPRP